MKKKNSDSKETARTNRSVAEEVATVAAVADPLEIEAALYFDILEVGLYSWVQEEQQHASTPTRDAGLSEPQRYVLECALRLIRQRARSRQRTAVFATTSQVQLLLQQTGRVARPKDIFLGWKHRIGAGDGSRSFQPVPYNNGNEYLVVLNIRGGTGRREIRADVVLASERDRNRALGLLTPMRESGEILIPITAAGQPDNDPATRSAAQTLYELFKREDTLAAREFLTFCEDRRISIVAVLRQLSITRKRVVRDRAAATTVIQVGNTLTVANTPSADDNESLPAAPLDPAAVPSRILDDRALVEVLERQEKERAARRAIEQRSDE